ncbi:MAG: radical SAM protein [Candidatus Omnitrophica bacterium]|nr:radical SAM protein [Candidatus Omnitrophota bacterium]
MKESIYILQCPPSWLKTAPLSLVYLENYLKSNGFIVKVRDLNSELFKSLQLQYKDWLVLNANFEEDLFTQTESSAPLKSFYQEIEDYEYIGFSLLKRNSSFSFRLAEKIREMFPSKKIIFGGPQTLFLDYQNKLDKDSFWVIGEGEYATAKIVTGTAERIQRFEELEDIDKLPFLDFSCLEMKNYSNSIPLLSSRGCKFNCNFCSEKKLYRTFRQHSPEYASDLIKYLAEKHKTDTFIFCDSLINYSNKWLEEFCTNLIKKNLKIKWEAQMRIDRDFDADVARLMKRSGCYNLFVGLESASAVTLKNMNKGFNPETALGFFKKLTEAGLHFEVSLIFGYPGETDVDFKETLDFIIKNKNNIPKIAQANPFVDYMGNFPDKTFPDISANERIKLFLRAIEAEKIKYTKSFINNLIYQCHSYGY